MKGATDKRESKVTLDALQADNSVLSILRDSRRRVRLGMASKKAAVRMDAAIAAVEELIAADDECYAAAVQVGKCMSVGTEEQKAEAMSRQTKANVRYLIAIAAVKRGVL